MQVVFNSLAVVALLTVPSTAWVSSNSLTNRVAGTTTNNKAVTALNMQSEHKAMSRKVFVNSLIAGAIVTSTGAVPSFADETLPNGVTYKVIKEGSGPKPEVGELVAIRFRAFCGEQKIDDIFDTPEPYYPRLGSGGLLAGVEQTLPLMRLGDRWELTIPVCTLFIGYVQCLYPVVHNEYSHELCSSVTVIVPSIFIFNRVTWLSVRRDALHRPEDLAFLRILRSSLKWKWSVSLVRKLNSLNLLVIRETRTHIYGGLCYFDVNIHSRYMSMKSSLSGH
jgi:hypothetical protein